MIVTQHLPSKARTSPEVRQELGEPNENTGSFAWLGYGDERRAEMKVSELIAHLVELVAEDGDIEVEARNSAGGFDAVTVVDSILTGPRNKRVIQIEP